MTVIVFFLLSKWIIRPFQEIISTMKKVELGRLQTRLQVRGKDEVAQIGLAFNRMIHQVEDLIVREYQAKFNQQQAEYRSLQAQIQPHFLYNILNGFIGLNRIGEREKLEESIIHLSKMLRYILGQRDWTSIKEECDFLAWYCQLQKLRFHDRLQYHITFDTACMDIQIPKLLLQPLVENSIIHGIEPLNYPREMKVNAQIHEDSFLSITVVDNGIGFNIDNTDKSVGLTNVKDRLLLAFPNGEFELVSSVGDGTSIHIKIPMKDVFR
ncbi:histidine kinase [Paenibacillus sp. G2S3]|uniref:sensor histidine kinase n=1 Tax=Paenibacillus sp. G2S3 TaxID=3047872 RepID=UPI0024C1382D|nr:histidine kinase [Paenibacillus sp. G2S3]WHY21402.1 histidine kinase [Paenibacillus sp. G2S3]